MCSCTYPCCILLLLISLILPPLPPPPSPNPGVVVSLARKYRVQLPVLTAVAQVLDGHISPREAVFEIMNLPQIEER